MTRHRWRPTAAAIVALATASANADVAPDAFGRPVTSIEIVSPANVDEAALRSDLPVSVGRPLLAADLEKSVSRLLEKQTFSSVEPEVEIDGGGARVRFRLVPRPVVTDVDVHVNALDEDDVRRRARLREDESLSAEEIVAARDRLRKFYAEEGYPDAKVMIEAMPVRPGEVRVSLRVDSGEATRLDHLILAGLPANLEAEARRALPIAEGRIFTAELPDDGRVGLLGFLRSRAHYEAEVEESHETEGRSATIRYDVEIGPTLQLAIEGNEAIPADDLLDTRALSTRPIITDGTWRVLAGRMEESYREQGFAFAEVETTIVPGNPKSVRFVVNEGPRVEVREIRFEGVQGIETATLLDSIETRTPSWLPYGDPGLFRRTVVDDDVERIHSRYRSAGWVDARVVDVATAFDDDGRNVRVTFKVDEGRRVRIAEVRVIGAEALLDNPAGALACSPGDAYDPTKVEADRATVIALLAERGHPSSKVRTFVGDRRPAADGDGDEVTVTHQAEPGEEVRIGRIVVRQNHFTLDHVIRRELDLASGDPFDPAKLLEAQRRVYRLGFFRNVSIAPIQDAGSPRDVAVDVGERPGGEVQYGFGYNTRAGLRNFVQLGHRNIRGTGRQASLRGDLNLDPTSFVPDEYIVNLEGREPRFLSSAYALRGNVVYQRSERSIDEFSIRRFAYSSGFEREFLPELRASFLLEFADSRIFDVAPDAVLTGKDTGRLRTVTLNPIVVYDGRDDAFAPTRGVFETFRIRYATPALGSEVHFAKLTLQHSHLVPLVGGWTFLYAARGGIAEPLGSSATIPLSERFFLGGRTSVRGFDENGIGPRGEKGNPIGGDLYLSGSVEIRFPLFWGLAGAGFLDAGGLYLRDREVSIAEVREAAGPGLRYQTPVGAVSLDFGFKIDRRSDESIGEVHFTIGNVF